MVWEIIYREKPQLVFFPPQTASNYSIKQQQLMLCDTYISMEFAERVDHIKPVHIYYSSVDDQLRPGWRVRA